MNHKISFALLFAGLFFFSTNSYAFFKGYVGSGYTFGELELDSGAVSDLELDGIKYAAGFYIQPVPLVPVGVGASAEFADPGDDDDSSIDRRRLFSLRPEATAWLPFVKIKKLKPFVKLGYTFGRMVVEGAFLASDFKYSGVHAGFGVAYSPLPLIEVLLQYNQGFEKAEVSGDSSTLGSSEEGDYKNKSILISVQAGI